MLIFLFLKLVLPLNMNLPQMGQQAPGGIIGWQLRI